jgi:hypothetical protein
MDTAAPGRSEARTAVIGPVIVGLIGVGLTYLH